MIDPIQSLLDLHDQLSLTVFNPQEEIPVRFQRGSVGWVGEVPIGVLAHVATCLSSFYQKVMEHTLEQSLKVEKLFLIHSDSP